MKHTKKLIPTLGMLLLSACMLVTSTFAWFSVNESVDATGMSVSAVGDQLYLQIVDGASDFTNKEAHKSAAGSVKLAADAGLTPAAVVEKIDNIGTGVDSVTAYNGGDFSWVTNTSDAADKSAAVNKYTNADSTSYYLLNTFKIRLNPKAGDTAAANPLRAAGITFTGTTDPLGNCVSVLVVGETSTVNDDGEVEGVTFAQLWKQDATNKWVESGDGKLTAAGFNYSTPLIVSVYVFFDGANSNCTINNLSTASNNYTIAVNFTVKAAPSQGDEAQG